MIYLFASMRKIKQIQIIVKSPIFPLFLFLFRSFSRFYFKCQKKNNKPGDFLKPFSRFCLF
jgi:hypothetical protein